MGEENARGATTLRLQETFKSNSEQFVCRTEVVTKDRGSRREGEREFNCVVGFLVFSAVYLI